MSILLFNFSIPLASNAKIKPMNKENTIISEIKVLLAKRGWTQEMLAQELGKRLNKKYTAKNLGNKLRLETIPYREIKLIADILGYKIMFEDINSNS